MKKKNVKYKKCPECGEKAPEKDLCYECNRPLDDLEFECQKCYFRFDEDGNEV